MITLKGMTWDHARGYDPMIATSKEYSKKNSDIEILWDKRSLQAFADRPIELMVHDYDFIVIDHPHVGEASTKKLLYNFSLAKNYSNQLEELSKRSVGMSHASYNFNNGQYALAIDAATPVAAYRPDLLDNIPSNINDVILLAEKNKVLWPLNPVFCITYFNSIAANWGMPINTPEKNFIDKKIGIEILILMKKLTKLLPQECLKMDPIQTLDFISENNDKIYSPMLYGYVNYSREGFRKNRIKFDDMPSFDTSSKINCKGSQIGGTGLAISAFSKNIDLALDYAFWVASKDCQSSLFYFSGGQPGHLDAWKNNQINEDSLNFFLSTLKTMEKGWVRPRYNGYMYFQDVAGSIINDFLNSDDKEEIIIDKLTSEFEKSFDVNK
jgi:multiple sugar transport system substrate-binding protein